MDNLITRDPTPCLVDAPAATVKLDEAIGALSLAYEAVFAEAGTNQKLAHAFSCMSLAISMLDMLRDELADAPSAEVAHGRA